jgi:hypothetical protein
MAVPRYCERSPSTAYEHVALSDEITYAIKAADLVGVGLSPARLHRSLSGNALKGGHGSKVAAAAGGYQVMPFSKPVAISPEEMSDLIERHHPMSRLT